MQWKGREQLLRLLYDSYRRRGPRTMRPIGRGCSSKRATGQCNRITTSEWLQLFQHSNPLSARPQRSPAEGVLNPPPPRFSLSYAGCRRHDRDQLHGSAFHRLVVGSPPSCLWIRLSLLNNKLPVTATFPLLHVRHVLALALCTTARLILKAVCLMICVRRT